MEEKSLTYEEFLRQKGRNRLVFTIGEALADLDTPLSCYIKMKKAFPDTPSFLLESVEQKERLGRFSILGLEPFLAFKSIEKKVILKGIIEDEFETDNPFEVLKNILKGFAITATGNNIPCFGGAVGYAGYDVVRFFEALPELTERTMGIYDMYFIFPSKLIIFDNFKRRMNLLTLTPVLDDKIDKDNKEGGDPLQGFLKILSSPISAKENKPFTLNGIKNNISKDEFEEMVRRAKKYIHEGDIIQVVLSQRFVLEVDADGLSLYRALRVVNPSPYMFLLEYPGYSLIGSSPETMVKMEDGEIEVRPIAGTRRRGRDRKEDEKLVKELLSDEKELAEHTMLVDLGKNEVGKVSATGSVSLPEFMTIEKYSHVMHIVSSVKGKIQDGLDAFHVFQATFPAGTVTGAPKIRAMEIIEELEKERREFYAGAVGYFSYNGDMDFCIAIRTLLKKGDYVYIQAGAGIVANSIPEKEYMETIYKSQALIKSIMEIKEIIGGYDFEEI